MWAERCRNTEEESQEDKDKGGCSIKAGWFLKRHKKTSGWDHTMQAVRGAMSCDLLVGQGHSYVGRFRGCRR